MMMNNKKLQECLVYRKNLDPFYYKFIRGRQITLASLSLFLQDVRLSDQTIKDLIRNLPNSDFGTNVCWVHYRHKDDHVEISYHYYEEDDEKKYFITTISELCLIFDTWREVRMKLPPYILVALDIDRNIIIIPINDLSELSELEYDIVNE